MQSRYDLVLRMRTVFWLESHPSGPQQLFAWQVLVHASDAYHTPQLQAVSCALSQPQQLHPHFHNC